MLNKMDISTISLIDVDLLAIYSHPQQRGAWSLGTRSTCLLDILQYVRDNRR